VSNAFYTPGEQRAAKVNDLFAAIARRYDLLNDLQSFGLHRRWKRRVVELAAVQSGNRALDLCCGTGDLALALARRGAEVIGFDFSQAMLEIAETRRRKNFKSQISNLKSNPQSATPINREHATKVGVRNPQFIQGDARQIPFPDASFDIVTVGYGLRNLTSWEKGLDEMHRVARPGARLVVLDFGKPANALWRAIYFGHLRCSVPLIGRLFCGNADAYAYILESLKHYPAQLAVAEKMRELKLVNVCVINFLGGAMAINYGVKPK
jgi:demethylmenaquinone methyltransferase/2-methoxy-6-polyprenyl-1,4-benzoquinol methylase